MNFPPCPAGWSDPLLHLPLHRWWHSWSLSLPLFIALTAMLSSNHPSVSLPLFYSTCILISNSQLCRAAPHYLLVAHQSPLFLCLGSMLELCRSTWTQLSKASASESSVQFLVVNMKGTQRCALRKHIPMSFVTYYFPYAHYLFWTTSPCTPCSLLQGDRHLKPKGHTWCSLCNPVFERSLSHLVMSSTKDWIKQPSWKIYLIYRVSISKLPNELIFVSKDNFSSLHLFWEPCLLIFFYVF